MRDILLVLAVAASLPFTLIFPYAGLLVWGWFSIMSPHRLLYGFGVDQPFNALIAAVTLGSLLLHGRERKRWPADALPKVMLGFVVWMTINAFFAADPDWSWPKWALMVKIFVFALLVMVMANTKARIHAMIWVIVISIAFYGIKGGIFTIVAGGEGRVFGPEGTMIEDNNQLALAIILTIPLANYLRAFTANRFIGMGLVFLMTVEVIAVLGSYSRGGVVALSVTLFVFWLRSRRKLLILALAAIVLGVGLSVMPDAFFERMDTIQDAGEDASFLGRWYAWQVAIRYATDHFPFGAGIYGPERDAVFHSYFPDQEVHAAHSIYFQVLGENGWPGLALYLAMSLCCWVNLRRVGRQVARRPGLAWAAELSRMMQVSLVGFWLGGALLSMAYYDVFLTLLALSSVLRELTAPPQPMRLSRAARVSAGREKVRPA